MKLLTSIAGFVLIFAASCQVLAEEPAHPLEKVRLQLKWLHQFQFAGYYAALQQGYYREMGLDVEILEASPRESAVDVVVRGDAEFGVHGSDLVVEHAKGKPIRVLSAIFQHSPMVLLARRDLGIDLLQDLAHRRILLGPDAAELAAYLKSEGITYQLASTHQSFDLQALLDGDVDAMPAYSSDEVYLMEEAHIPYSEFTPRAAGIDFYGDVLFTSEKELKAHPDVVRRFVDASLRGWYYALSHRDEMAQLIYTKYSQRHTIDHLLFEAEEVRRLMTPELVEIGHMSPGRWRHIADTFSELGMMPVNYPLDDFLPPKEAPPEDNRQLYAIIGAALVAVALAVWVSLHFLRLNHALRREVGERKRLQENLERLANTDALTGLPNRRFFMAQLENELSRRKRYGHPLTLLMLDLDHFKLINDKWGHAVGDEALRLFANSVQCCLRTQDVVGRLGGEEFAIVLPETNTAAAHPVAERVRARIEQTQVPTETGRCNITVSIGLAEAQGTDDLESLLHHADQSLYAAKEQGRNRIVSYADMHTYHQESTLAA